MNDTLKIKQATKDGTIEVGAYGAFDASFPNSTTRRGRVQDGGRVTPTLTAGSQEICVVEPRCKVVGTIDIDGWQERMRRVHSTDGIAPAMTTMGGGNLEPKIMETVYAYDEQNNTIRNDGTVGTLTTDGSSPKHNNRVIEKYELSDKMKGYLTKGNDKYSVGEGNLVLNRDIACTKTTREGCTRADSSDYISTDFEENAQLRINQDLLPYHIRKLTEKECWRLMGVKDEDYAKVAKGQSRSSMYHLAGDSIVTSVLMALFGEMFGLDWESKVKGLVRELANEHETVEQVSMFD